MVAALGAAWLLLAAVACSQREQDFYDFKAVNIRGKLVSLEKYRGSVSARPGGAPPPCVLRGVAPRGLGLPRVTAPAPSPHPAIRRGRRAPPDPAQGLFCSYVARPWRTVKPETLGAGSGFPDGDFGPLPEAGCPLPTPPAQPLSRKGGKGNRSIPRPLPLPSPVPTSATGSADF